jgi:hypothetical protein
MYAYNSDTRRRGRSLLAVDYTVSNQTVDLVYGVMNATNLLDTSQVRTGLASETGRMSWIRQSV